MLEEIGPPVLVDRAFALGRLLRLGNAHVLALRPGRERSAHIAGHERSASKAGVGRCDVHWPSGPFAPSRCSGSLTKERRDVNQKITNMVKRRATRLLARVRGLA